MEHLEDRKAVLCGFWRALCEKRFSEARALLAPGATWNHRSVGTVPALPMVDAIAQTFGYLTVHMSFPTVIAEGATVALVAEGEGQFANGVQYNNHYCFVAVVRDGLIYNVREFTDTLLVAETFGKNLPADVLRKLFANG